MRTQSVLGTYIVECRVSIIGMTIMIWGESIPHSSTWDPGTSTRTLRSTAQLMTELHAWYILCTLPYVVCYRLCAICYMRYSCIILMYVALQTVYYILCTVYYMPYYYIRYACC